MSKAIQGPPEHKAILNPPATKAPCTPDLDSIGSLVGHVPAVITARARQYARQQIVAKRRRIPNRNRRGTTR